MRFAVLSLAAIAMPLHGSTPRDPADVVLAQLMVRERVVVRVPAQRMFQPPIRWREKRGPRCIAVADIGGAAITGGDTVDFILRGGGRVRAKLQSACPALDYYHGFYLRPPADGRICQDRDVIHARSGGECVIDKFRALVAKPPK